MVVRIIFYSARGMNHWVSIFSEGIILDDYCCTNDVLTLSSQNVFNVANVFCKSVLCSTNVLPLSACFLNMCSVLTCAFLSQDKIVFASVTEGKTVHTRHLTVEDTTCIQLLGGLHYIQLRRTRSC
jgi:hypothetical protein